MNKLKIVFLGTGNAIPTKKRNHTAILLSYKNENILIDCGEGTQKQFKIAKISPNKLTKLLITHWHGDHVLGIPGLLQTLAMNNYTKTLEVFGPKGTTHSLSLMQQLFKLKINLKIKEVEGKFLKIEDLEIESEKMDHDIPSLAYSFEVKDQIRLNKKSLKKLKLPNSPLLGELKKGKDIVFESKKIKASSVTYKEKGKKISIILDTAPNSNAIKLAKNSDIVICESTYSKEDKAQALEHKHMTAEDAGLLAKKAKIKSLILTHISERYQHNESKILNEAKKLFKNTKLANDFDSLEI
ncbi:MAG: ribonuclease Z [Nanoarchaeota archaeon]